MYKAGFQLAGASWLMCAMPAAREGEICKLLKETMNCRDAVGGFFVFKRPMKEGDTMWHKDDALMDLPRWRKMEKMCKEKQIFILVTMPGSPTQTVMKIHFVLYVPSIKRRQNGE